MQRGVFDYLLALHETELIRGRARFGERLSGRATVVGQPKFDTLLALAGSSRETVASLGLDPARKTVLFMSHWTPTSLMHTCGEEVLRFLETRRDVNVLITGHYHHWATSRAGRLDWRGRLAWIADAPHMRLLPAREDLAALMAASDVAITDHTSAILEYAALYRPMVLYRNPEHPFTEPDVEARLRGTSNVFTGMREFPAAFEEAMAGRRCDRAGRTKLLDCCFRYLGESSPRAAVAVEQVAWNGVFDDSDHSS